jgi:integrase
MPLKLIPPSKKRRTPFYSIRGHYLGIAVDRSTKTDRRTLAKAILKRWETKIERGEYRLHPEAIETGSAPRTFAEAAIAYMQAGGERRFLGPAVDILGLKPIADIDQLVIDAAAAQAFPQGSAAYRNRNFYTPVSAVLKHVGIERKLRRPKGWRGNRSTSWLEPEQAFALFRAADDINAEFGLFLRVLAYTGMRLSEALGVRLAQVNVRQQMIYLPETKNGEARPVHLPPMLIAALANHPRGLSRDPNDRLFRFHASGRLRNMLSEAKRPLVSCCHGVKGGSMSSVTRMGPGCGGTGGATLLTCAKPNAGKTQLLPLDTPTMSPVLRLGGLTCCLSRNVAASSGLDVDSLAGLGKIQ